ncbi:Neisseria PilC beta-propeller domain protein [compost metagenome]
MTVLPKSHQSKKSYWSRLLPLLLLVFQHPGWAEDIDLFVGTPPNAASAPNVLIILDNTANWNTPFSNEIDALSSVISALEADQFRVGLMLFTETGKDNKGNDGAYVRAAIRLLDADTKLKYQALVDSLDVGEDKGNAGKAGKAMQEAYLYFSAGTPYAGNQKVKTDYAGNPAGTDASGETNASGDIYALAGNALPSKNATQYVNPVVGGCAKNFVIYISNGAAQDSNNDITQATEALRAVGGDTSAIPISPSGSQDNVADEWARFMKKSDLGITVYTVDVNKVTTGQGPGWTALLKSMANVTSGTYFDVASTGSEIANALNSIFSKIQATNSVFASVSLPVSVNTQGTFLNQVFVGMFRPDQGGLPRWAGNLKQYRLGLAGDVLRLQDAKGDGAINSNTGFIDECARSFWTPEELDTYWAFRPQGACLTVPDSDKSNTPDGNIVEKGAQAYVLRSGTARTVKTCSPDFDDCNGLTNFATDNDEITADLLGAADAAERDQLINWARGQDNRDENTNENTTEMRPSVHGDVVHSRPVAINYGTDTSPQIVVFYGGNDGLLHAVNGNRAEAIGGFAAGREIWSFMPPEFYRNIKRLRDNNVAIAFPGHTTGDPTPQPKPYGIDGTITAIRDGSDSTVFATMRRGGRVLYAFDVSTFNDPELKWKIGCPNLGNDDDCSSEDIEEIGQTWSSAVPARARGHQNGDEPILLMGGGYDNCEDADPNTCGSAGKGDAIYVLDAESGDLLKSFDTLRGVVGDISLLNDSSGMLTYAYAADLGGNLYRISGATANTPIGDTPPGSWSITRIASLGCDTPTVDCSANRKFFFGPDIVVDNGDIILLVGSGDREKPLLSYDDAAGVANRFFMVRDRPNVTTWLTDEDGACGGASLICMASLLDINSSATPTAAQLSSAPKGWSLALASTEQVVTAGLTVFGNVTFSTHQPRDPNDTSSCSGLGTAQVYNVNFRNAEGTNTDRFQVIAGGGLPPSPVAGMVKLDNGVTVPFIIGASGDSPLESTTPEPPPGQTQPKARVYWNIEQ